MRLKLAGGMLIEISVATGVFLVALTAILLTFTQINRSSARNRETSLALHFIATQVDADAQVSYAALNNDNPTPSKSTQLPSATLERQVIEFPELQVKAVRYIVRWQGQYGPRTLHADHEITPLGLAND